MNEYKGIERQKHYSGQSLNYLVCQDSLIFALGARLNSFYVCISLRIYISKRQPFSVNLYCITVLSFLVTHHKSLSGTGLPYKIKLAICIIKTSVNCYQYKIIYILLPLACFFHCHPFGRQSLQRCATWISRIQQVTRPSCWLHLLLWIIQTTWK